MIGQWLSIGSQGADDPSLMIENMNHNTTFRLLFSTTDGQTRTSRTDRQQSLTYSHTYTHHTRTLSHIAPYSHTHTHTHSLTHIFKRTHSNAHIHTYTHPHPHTSCTQKSFSLSKRWLIIESSGVNFSTRRDETKVGNRKGRVTQIINFA